MGNDGITFRVDRSATTGDFASSEVCSKRGFMRKAHTHIYICTRIRALSTHKRRSFFCDGYSKPQVNACKPRETGCTAVFSDFMVVPVHPHLITCMNARAAVVLSHSALLCYIAQIIGQQALGYGTYLFQATGQFNSMDMHTTWGMFTYDDCSADAEHVSFRELDFEISTWNNVCRWYRCALGILAFIRWTC